MMVSFWPWKGDDTASFASFERTLSSLSDKIKKANVRHDGLRTSSRRYKVIWTLYSSLAYLVASLVLVLVTGWESWGPVEYTAVAGGPVLIYLVRTSLDAFYNYRLSSNQSHLNDLNKQRDAAIEKFKKATKYNSTQQLLEKYGAAPKQPPSQKDSPASSAKRKSAANDSSKKPTPQRTNLPPPPTANIRRPAAADNQGPITPSQSGVPPYGQGSAQHTPVRQQIPDHNALYPISPDASSSFAPNAFTSTMSSPPQYSDSSQRQWYDRIFDVILGEDETRATNRLALICQHCKLVNGQAPPGVKTMEDVGRWRCRECRGWNGVENEVDKMLEVAKGDEVVETSPKQGPRYSVDDSADVEVEGEPGPAVDPDGISEKEEVEEDADESEPPARSTRSRKKGSQEEG